MKWEDIEKMRSKLQDVQQKRQQRLALQRERSPVRFPKSSEAMIEAKLRQISKVVEQRQEHNSRYDRAARNDRESSSDNSGRGRVERFVPQRYRGRSNSRSRSRERTRSYRSRSNSPGRRGRVDRREERIDKRSRPKSRGRNDDRRDYQMEPSTSHRSRYPSRSRDTGAFHEEIVTFRKRSYFCNRSQSRSPSRDGSDGYNRTRSRPRRNDERLRLHDSPESDEVAAPGTRDHQERCETLTSASVRGDEELAPGSLVKSTFAHRPSVHQEEFDPTMQIQQNAPKELSPIKFSFEREFQKFDALQRCGAGTSIATTNEQFPSAKQAWNGQLFSRRPSKPNPSEQVQQFFNQNLETSIVSEIQEVVKEPPRRRMSCHQREEKLDVDRPAKIKQRRMSYHHSSPNSNTSIYPKLQSFNEIPSSRKDPRLVRALPSQVVPPRLSSPQPGPSKKPEEVSTIEAVEKVKEIVSSIPKEKEKSADILKNLMEVLGKDAFLKFKTLLKDVDEEKILDSKPESIEKSEEVENVSKVKSKSNSGSLTNDKNKEVQKSKEEKPAEINIPKKIPVTKPAPLSRLEGLSNISKFTIPKLSRKGSIEKPSSVPVIEEKLEKSKATKSMDSKIKPKDKATKSQESSTNRKKTSKKSDTEQKRGSSSEKTKSSSVGEAAPVKIDVALKSSSTKRKLSTVEEVTSPSKDPQHKKKFNELDRLHKDISEYYDRDGIVSANGSRACRKVTKYTDEAEAATKSSGIDLAKFTKKYKLKTIRVVLNKMSLDGIPMPITLSLDAIRKYPQLSSLRKYIIAIPERVSSKPTEDKEEQFDVNAKVAKTITEPPKKIAKVIVEPPNKVDKKVAEPPKTVANATDEPPKIVAKEIVEPPKKVQQPPQKKVVESLIQIRLSSAGKDSKITTDKPIKTPERLDVVESSEGKKSTENVIKTPPKLLQLVGTHENTEVEQTGSKPSDMPAQLMEANEILENDAKTLQTAIEPTQATKKSELVGKYQKKKNGKKRLKLMKAFKNAEEKKSKLKSDWEDVEESTEDELANTPARFEKMKLSVLSAFLKQRGTNLKRSNLAKAVKGTEPVITEVSRSNEPSALQVLLQSSTQDQKKKEFSMLAGPAEKASLPNQSIAPRLLLRLKSLPGDKLSTVSTAAEPDSIRSVELPMPGPFVKPVHTVTPHKVAPLILLKSIPPSAVQSIQFAQPPTVLNLLCKEPELTTIEIHKKEILLRPWLEEAHERASMKTPEAAREMVENHDCLGALYKCMASSCTFFTSGFYQFQKHLKLHEEREMFIKDHLLCAYCTYQAGNCEDLAYHIITYHNFPMQCAHCFYRAFNDFQILTQHHQKYHPDLEKCVIQCGPDPNKKIDMKKVNELMAFNVVTMRCFSEYFCRFTFNFF